MSMAVGYYAEALAGAAFLALDAGSWRVNLSKSGSVPTKASVPADFTAPAYPGYASQPTGGWGTGAIDGAGNYTTPGLTSLSFVPTSTPGSPQTVDAWWVDDGAGHFLFGKDLSTPFVFSGTGTELVLVPSFSAGQLAP